MTTHRAPLLLAPLILCGTVCTPGESRPVYDAAIYYEATGGEGGVPLLYCPGATEQIIVPEAEPWEPYEPLAAWCSWSCARYEPEYPEPGSLVLMIERADGALTVLYWPGCD